MFSSKCRLLVSNSSYTLIVLDTINTSLQSVEKKITQIITNEEAAHKYNYIHLFHVILRVYVASSGFFAVTVSLQQMGTCCYVFCLVTPHGNAGWSSKQTKDSHRCFQYP